jgi:FixJ family two-component response regulator
VSRLRPLIAVVDDEEPVRKALRRLMRSSGFDAESFASGAAFLASVEGSVPDCLVLDLHMPGLSGFEVQRRFARTHPLVPVVVITGHDLPETKSRVLAAGAAAYLRKPVDAEMLLGAISSSLAAADEATGTA